MIHNLELKIGYWILGLLGFFLIGSFLSCFAEQTMSNDNYIIKTQNFNTASDTTGEQNANPKPTTKTPGMVTSEGVNFQARTGFENRSSTATFSILLSPGLVDFGVFSPTNPIIRTVDLSVNSESTYAYSVLVFENEPLTINSSKDNVFIPNTTCDLGACGTETASEWTNALTYGFGYRCDNATGTDCEKSFARSNFYKRFPDLSNNDDSQSIMTGAGADNKTARISYKVNISGTQPQGTYSNTITYLAIPNF